MVDIDVSIVHQGKRTVETKISKVIKEKRNKRETQRVNPNPNADMKDGTPKERRKK